MFNKERLAAFTDAIVAIAATIMVLELKVPAVDSLSGLSEDMPIFMAYIISFSQIYIVWKNHHDLFEKAHNITTRTFVLNGIWLFFCTLVPFHTHWVGSSYNHTLPELLYILDLALWTISFQIMDINVLVDNPEASRDSTGHKHLLAMIFTGFIIAAIVAIIRPSLTLVVMLLFTIGEIIWMIAKGNNENV